MIWKKDGLKYLGVFLGNTSIVLKNWEDVIAKIEGKLSKWKWLLPQMSFKGRVLVLNNLCGPSLGLTSPNTKEVGGFLLGGSTLGATGGAVFI